jgi:hypothetical protein
VWCKNGTPRQRAVCTRYGWRDSND